MIEARFQVALAHARDLTRVAADGQRRRPNTLSPVQKKEHPNPAPDAGAQLFAPSLHPT